MDGYYETKLLTMNKHTLKEAKRNPFVGLPRTIDGNTTVVATTSI
jgi:hypothetical protein